ALLEARYGASIKRALAKAAGSADSATNNPSAPFAPGTPRSAIAAAAAGNGSAAALRPFVSEGVPSKAKGGAPTKLQPWELGDIALQTTAF
ncbi:hypothetical protein OH407_23965, partial [Salmonella enterica]|uniref:hypothetical protein n=1 Tax=Salmonella enterica TaxID=28901 RepID=UPI0022B6DC4B